MARRPIPADGSVLTGTARGLQAANRDQTSPQRGHLNALARIAVGDLTAGPIAALEQGERFHWLSSPSSTMIQPSPVHGGVTTDPSGTLEKLFDQMVASPERAANGRVPGKR